MYPYLGDFPTGATIFVPFHTFGADGQSITLTGLAVTDIEIYKNASITQRSSDAGYALVDTDGIDIDGITGIHGFTVDTSDNTDSGFYAAGNDYTIVVSAVTVDTQTVNFIAARFSIDNRGLLRPTTASRTLDVSATGAAGIDLNNIELPVGPIPALGIIENGTLQSATASTAVLRSATSLADDLINNVQLEITGGTGAGQQRVVTDWVSATDTATVSPNWTTTPDNTSTYIVRAMAPAPTAAGTLPSVSVAEWLGATVATPTVAGVPEVDLTHIAGSNTDVSTLAASVAAILVDTGTTLDAFIQAVKTKTDFLPSATAGSAGGVFIAGSNAATSITTALTANVVGNVTGNLSGSVGSVTGLTASDVGAIKNKTDSLTFTTAGMVDSAIKRVGDTTLSAAGTGGQGYGA